MAKTGSDRGHGLAEMLVALALLALGLSLGLELHVAARRSFRTTAARAERQQDLRAAFSAIRRSLRLAGYNSLPTGDPLGAGEQLEAAFDGAIMFRADFDGASAEAGTPETELSGGAWTGVTVGNDEIVGFVLAKPDGSSGGTLRFEADVTGVPRDGVAETVSMRNIAVTQDDPPYTLYRLSVRHDSAAIFRAPVMDHVFSLRFSYHDASGSELPAPGGADEPVPVRARASVRRIGVELAVLLPGTPEASPTPSGVFRLFGEIAPPNLGLYGFPDPAPPPG